MLACAAKAQLLSGLLLGAGRRQSVRILKQLGCEVAKEGLVIGGQVPGSPLLVRL